MRFAFHYSQFTIRIHVAVSKWLRPLLTATAFLGIPFVSFEPAKQLTAPLDALDAPASTIYAIYVRVYASVSCCKKLCSILCCALQLCFLRSVFRRSGFPFGCPVFGQPPPPLSNAFCFPHFKKNWPRKFSLALLLQEFYENVALYFQAIK